MTPETIKTILTLRDAPHATPVSDEHMVSALKYVTPSHISEFELLGFWMSCLTRLEFLFAIDAHLITKYNSKELPDEYTPPAV